MDYDGAYYSQSLFKFSLILTVKNLKLEIPNGTKINIFEKQVYCILIFLLFEAPWQTPERQTPERQALEKTNSWKTNSWRDKLLKDKLLKIKKTSEIQTP